MKAKTSYRRRRTEPIVERLEAECKELDIGIEAELEAERIEVAAKVGCICLYLEVVEEVGQADPNTSNLLAFLEDSEAEGVAERIEVAGKLDSQVEALGVG